MLQNPNGQKIYILSYMEPFTIRKATADEVLKLGTREKTNLRRAHKLEKDAARQLILDCN